MKRSLSIILCIVLLLSFTACADGGKDNGVDFNRYAKEGRINEVDYKLGDDVDETKEALSAEFNNAENAEEDDHAAHEVFYYDFESGDYTVMTDGEISCCYLTDDKDAGITHIIKVGGAYGFNLGTMSTEIRDAMSKNGFEATEREAEKGELFFLPSSPGMTVLEYEVKDNNVLFVFTEHALSATVIFKK